MSSQQTRGIQINSVGVKTLRDYIDVKSSNNENFMKSRLDARHDSPRQEHQYCFEQI